MPPTKCVSLFLFRETACIRVYAVLTHEHSMQRGLHVFEPCESYTLCAHCNIV